MLLYVLMSPFEHPPIPEDDSFRDEPLVSEEQVAELLRDNLDRPKDTETSMPQEHFDELKTFFQDLQVVGSENIYRAEVELIYAQLLENPWLVKDFTYVVMDLKSVLEHSEYPIALKMEELTPYAAGMSKPEDIRYESIKKGAPYITGFGLDRYQYVQSAMKDTLGGEKTRFLAWLVSQPFQRQLPTRVKEFQKDYGFDTITVRNIGGVATVVVSESLQKLKESSDIYKSERLIESNARQRHEDTILAMQGIYKMCDKYFLTPPEPEK